MHQVTQNILLNADQAMPQGGIIEISLKNIKIKTVFVTKLLDIDNPTLFHTRNEIGNEIIRNKHANNYFL